MTQNGNATILPPSVHMNPDTCFFLMHFFFFFHLFHRTAVSHSSSLLQEDLLGAGAVRGLPSSWL